MHRCPENDESWDLALFPNRRIREEFLDQVRLWNRMEAMPSVEMRPMGDGLRVRLSTSRAARFGVRRLVDAYGGWIGNDHTASHRASPDLM